MANRYWGLSRRQTIVTFAAVVVVGIVIGLIIGPGGSDGSGGSPDRTGRIEPGTPASPRAVWAFGFDTLRFDPALRLRGRLPVQGFGTVLGSPGRVDLYDPASGRTGTLTSATNRLRSTGRIAPGVAPTAPFASLVAVTRTHRWLVPRPGTVVRVGRDSTRDPVTVTVGEGVVDPTATAVTVAGDTVYAATAGSGGVTVVRLSADGTTAAATASVTTATTIDGFAADRSAVWVLAGGTAYALDPTTLAVTRPVTVTGRGPGEVRGLAAAGGGVFTLADNGASLVRVDGSAPQVALQILPTPLPTFRLPASITSFRDRVYALAPRSAAANDRRSRLAGYDVRRGRPTRAVDLPSALFAGAVAAT